MATSTPKLARISPPPVQLLTSQYISPPGQLSTNQDISPPEHLPRWPWYLPTRTTPNRPLRYCIQIYARFFSEHIVTSYSINLLFINEPQCLESSLHTLFVAMSGKLSGCQEKPLFESYAYNLNTLPKRSFSKDISPPGQLPTSPQIWMT